MLQPLTEEAADMAGLMAACEIHDDSAAQAHPWRMDAASIDESSICSRLDPMGSCWELKVLDELHSPPSNDPSLSQDSGVLSDWYDAE